MNDILEQDTLSIVSDGEFVNATGCAIQADAIKIASLTPSLPYHRIYLYQEAVRAGADGPSADFYVDSNVTLWRNNKAVGVLSSSFGVDVGNTLLKKTLFSEFVIAGNVVNAVPSASNPDPSRTFNAFTDAIILCLNSGFTNAQNPILNPRRVSGIIDRLSYSITGCQVKAGNSFSSFRAFCVIRSSASP